MATWSANDATGTLSVLVKGAGLVRAAVSPAVSPKPIEDRVRTWIVDAAPLERARAILIERVPVIKPLGLS
jgi:hypothetical protein